MNTYKLHTDDDNKAERSDNGINFVRPADGMTPESSFMASADSEGEKRVQTPPAIGRFR